MAIRDEVLTANARIGVAYEMLFALVARSGSQRHSVTLNNAGVHLLRLSLRVASQRIVCKTIAPDFAILVWVIKIGGNEVLLILGKHHVVGACAASLRPPSIYYWACLLIFAAFASTRNKRQTSNQYHEHCSKMQDVVL